MTDDANAPDGAPAPTPPGAPAPTPSGGPASKPAGMAGLDGAALQVVGGGIAVAVISVIGLVFNIWPFTWTGLVLIVFGLGTAAVAYLRATGLTPAQMPISGRFIELATALVATVIGVGGIVESIFDLDSLDVAEIIVYALLAATGMVLILAVGRTWPGGASAITAPLRPGANRGGRLAFLGVLVAILGWLVNVTVGVWNWYPAALVLSLLLLVLVIILMISEDATGPRLPIPASWVAAAIAIVAGVIALDHLRGFLALGSDGFSAGLEDWLGMLLYLAGVALVIAGSILMAMADRPIASAPGQGANGDTPSSGTTAG